MGISSILLKRMSEGGRDAPVFVSKIALIWFDLLCLNATFSNISAISWRPVLVVEEAGFCINVVTTLTFLICVQYLRRIWSGKLSTGGLKVKFRYGGTAGVWKNTPICILEIRKLYQFISWIYYLSNQCLSPLKLRVRIPLIAKCTRYNIMWYFVSELWQVGGFLRVPPPVKLTATI